MPFIGPTRPFKPPALTPQDIADSTTLLHATQNYCSLFDPLPLQRAVTATSNDQAPANGVNGSHPQPILKCSACSELPESAPKALKDSGLPTNPKRIIQRLLATALSRLVLGVPSSQKAGNTFRAQHLLGSNDCEQAFNEAVRTVVETCGLVFLRHCAASSSSNVDSEMEEAMSVTFDELLFHNVGSSDLDAASPTAEGPSLAELKKRCCSRFPPDAATSPTLSDTQRSDTANGPTSSWSKGLLYGSSGLGAATADSDIDVLLLLRPDFAKVADPANGRTQSTTHQLTSYEIYQRTLALRDCFIQKYPRVIESVMAGVLHNVLDLVAKDVLVVWEISILRRAWDGERERHEQQGGAEAAPSKKTLKAQRAMEKRRINRHFKPDSTKEANEGADSPSAGNPKTGQKRQRDITYGPRNGASIPDDGSSSPAEMPMVPPPPYSLEKELGRLVLLTFEEGELLLKLTTDTMLCRASNSLWAAATTTSTTTTVTTNNAAKVQSDDRALLVTPSSCSSPGSLRETLLGHALHDLLLPVAAATASISLSRVRLTDQHRKRLLRAKNRLYRVAATVIGKELGVTLHHQVADCPANGGSSMSSSDECDGDNNTDDVLAGISCEGRGNPAKRVVFVPAKGDNNSRRWRRVEHARGEVDGGPAVSAVISNSDAADEYRRRVAYHGGRIRGTLLEMLLAVAVDKGPDSAALEFGDVDPIAPKVSSTTTSGVWQSLSGGGDLDDIHPVTVTAISAARVPVLKLKICGVHTDIILGVLDTNALDDAPFESMKDAVSEFVEDVVAVPPTTAPVDDGTAVGDGVVPTLKRIPPPPSPIAQRGHIRSSGGEAMGLLPLGNVDDASTSFPYAHQRTSDSLQVVVQQRGIVNRATVDMLLCSAVELEALGGHPIDVGNLRAALSSSSNNNGVAGRQQHPYFETQRVMNQVPVHGMRLSLNGVRTITCIPSLLPDHSECTMFLVEGLRIHFAGAAEHDQSSSHQQDLIDCLNRFTQGKGGLSMPGCSLQPVGSGFHFNRVYQPALRYIKRWVSSVGVYGNLYTYLPGVSVAVLVARACQLLPTVALNKLISFFFAFYERILGNAIKACDSKVDGYIRFILSGERVPSKKSAAATEGSWITFTAPSPIFLSRSLFTSPASAAPAGAGQGGSSSASSSFKIQGMLESYVAPALSTVPAGSGSSGGALQDALPIINPAYPFTVTSHTAGRTCVATLHRELILAKQFLAVATSTTAAAATHAEDQGDSLPLLRLLNATSRRTFLTVHSPLLRHALTRRNLLPPGSVPNDFGKRLKLVALWASMLSHHRSHLAHARSPSVASLYAAVKEEPADRMLLLAALGKLVTSAEAQLAAVGGTTSSSTAISSLGNLAGGWKAVLEDFEETEAKEKSLDPSVAESRLSQSDTHDGLLCVDALFLPPSNTSTNAHTSGFEMWAGFVESRFRMLVYLAESLAASNFDAVITAALNADVKRASHDAHQPPPNSHEKRHRQPHNKRHREDGPNSTKANTMWIRHVCETVLKGAPSSGTIPNGAFSQTSSHSEEPSSNGSDLQIHLIGVKSYTQRIDRQVSVPNTSEAGAVGSSSSSGTCGTCLLGLRFVASCLLTSDTLNLADSKELAAELGSHKSVSEVKKTLRSESASSPQHSRPSQHRLYWRPSLAFLHSHAPLVEAELRKLLFDFNETVESAIARPPPPPHPGSHPTVSVANANASANTNNNNTNGPSSGSFVREPGMKGPYHRLLLIPDEFKRRAELTTEEAPVDVPVADEEPAPSKGRRTVIPTGTAATSPVTLGDCCVCGAKVYNKAGRKKRRGGTKRSVEDVAAVAEAAERATGAWQLAESRKWESRPQEGLAGLFGTVCELLLSSLSGSPSPPNSPFSSSSPSDKTAKKKGAAQAQCVIQRKSPQATRSAFSSDPHTVFRLLFKQVPSPFSLVARSFKAANANQGPTATQHQYQGLVKLPMGVEVHKYSTAALISLYEDCLSATHSAATPTHHHHQAEDRKVKTSFSGDRVVLPYDLYRLLIPKELIEPNDHL